METYALEFGDIKAGHTFRQQCAPEKTTLFSFLTLPQITLFGFMVLLISLFYLKSVPLLHSNHLLDLDDLHSYFVREKLNLFFLPLTLAVEI